jgi:hypothetical protein
MSIDENSLILSQRKQVFETVPVVELIEACSIGTGVVVLSESDKRNALEQFNLLTDEISYFIPASGSGSRMFHALHQYIETGEMSEDCKVFFDKLPTFALYEKIAMVTREKLEVIDQISLARYLLHKEGLNLSDTPKGLIPFHHLANKVLNPFQEHVLQASKLFPEGVKMHFTIDQYVEDDVRYNVLGLGNVKLENIEISFSNQNEESHAYCFDEDKEPIRVNEKYLRRPAGHGALLRNLNALDADLVLIKNIDNIQHYNRCDDSNEVAKFLLGTVKVFQNELQALQSNFSMDKLVELNAKYQWMSEESIAAIDEVAFGKLLERPTRVCGMVKNEGEPGGGPFWIKGNDGPTKQIIEKVQIASVEDQQEIMAGSSHFNPVLIAALTTDVSGNKLDLERFSNDEKYLNVKKPHKGKTIYYRELPGLWNGGMYHWNTLFVEVPSKVFSPVKSVLDLMAEEHQA